MRNPEIAAKVSASRSERFRIDEAFRQRTSELMRKAWKDSKFDGTKVGKCKWYEFTKIDGTVCKVQGTWELAYAKWLDMQGIYFIAHRGRIMYTDECGRNRSYYPDFYLLDTDEYVDIKNEYHFRLNEQKWDQIRKSNSDLKIILLFKEQLQELGVL
jgi:DnaJ-domain-containing protein 1